jgi:hypothetical protein
MRERIAGTVLSTLAAHNTPPVSHVRKNRGYCSRERERGRGPAARAVRGAGNAGRGASPTAGHREGFSF